MPDSDPVPIQARPVVNISASRFAPLTRLEERRERLQAACLRLGMKGTILLSPKGINLFVPADRAAIDQLLAKLSSDTELGPLDVKESLVGGRHPEVFRALRAGPLSGRVFCV